MAQTWPMEPLLLGWIWGSWLHGWWGIWITRCSGTQTSSPQAQMTDRPGCVCLQLPGMTIPLTCMTRPCWCHGPLSSQCLTHRPPNLGPSKGLSCDDLPIPRLPKKAGETAFGGNLCGSSFILHGLGSFSDNKSTGRNMRYFLYFEIFLLF